MKILIVGGGVAGLAIGWRLAESGCEVEILERGLAGRASSWAAAGMLAATAETGNSESAHARLARAGRAAWPEFAARVQSISEKNIGYRECGALLIAQTMDRAAHLKSVAETLAAKGEAARWLTPDEAVAREPLLGAEFRGALYAPDDSQVDNRLLSEALAEAFAKSGGTLRENCDVHALETKSGRVGGVKTSDGSLAADKVVIAAGAWSSSIGGIESGILPPVRPAKGQMTALAPVDGAPMPNGLIWGEEIVYLVPRTNTLLVGATVEDTGFETSVSRDARDDLIARATRLIPSLKDWRVVESWAGLRPRTSDDSPVLGETAINGLYVASGQYRNGILFAPVIAEMMCDAVMGRDPDKLFREFSPSRFLESVEN
jgi:glycine oxidase